jgi:hypothetical protein
MRGQPARPVRWEATRKRTRPTAGTSPRGPPNTPALHAQLARLPWHHVPVADRTRDRAHGRIELRTLKAISVRHFGFPHAAQVIQVTRKSRDLHTTRWRTVTVYAVTSLPFEQTRPAAWPTCCAGTGPALHHLRDTTFAEDACQVRTGNAPRTMASLRNLAIGILHAHGHRHLAAALRRNARDATRVLPLLGITSP